MNVLCPEDKENERRVMAKTSELLKDFKGIEFIQNPDNSDNPAIFDFDGYFLGIKKIRADVKVLNCKPSQWPCNICSREKYNEYVQNKNLSYYLIYYYRNYKTLRVFDMDKVTMSLGYADIYHERKEQDRHDSVAYLPIGGAILEIGVDIECLDANSAILKSEKSL